jgi:hypothetical protein
MKAELSALGDEHSAERTPSAPHAAARTLCKDPRLSPEGRLAACNSGEPHLWEAWKITVPPFINPCEWQFEPISFEAGLFAQVCAAHKGAHAGATTKARSVIRLANLASQACFRDGATLLIGQFLRYAAAYLASTWLLGESFKTNRALLAVAVRVFVDHHFAGEGAINVGEVSRRQNDSEDPPG